MKRIISILVLAAMVLASILAIVPVSATETADTPTVTYEVNWKKIYDNKGMQAQWWNEDTAKQNNYDSLYTVTATENSISSAPKGEADNRSYYSKTMFTLTADSYYEYTFMAKNNRAKGYAGVIFAYDVTGKYPYFVYGAFQNESLAGATTELSFRKGHQSREGSEINSDKKATPVVKLTEDGYGQYKIVYSGFNAKLYYIDENGNYAQAGDNVLLPEGSKICFGVYSCGGPTRSQNTISLKDCVLTAYDEASALSIPKQELEGTVAMGEKFLSKSGYTVLTLAALNTAITDAKAVIENAESTADDYNTAIANIFEKLAGLKNAANKKALEAKINEAEAAFENLTSADFVEDTWIPFDAALTTAKAALADTEIEQGAVDEATLELTDALMALTRVGQANKNYLKVVIDSCANLKEDTYSVTSWSAYKSAYDAANTAFATEEISQDDVDKAKKDLEDAIAALVKKAEKAELLETIAKAEAYDKDDYYASSWKIDEALAMAKTVAQNDNATQAEVDSAKKALSDAIDALISMRHNVLYIGPDPTPLNYNGEGNVFYIDYHKYIAAKGYTAGVKFPMSLEDAKDQGNADYVLRLGTISGSGTTSACDGNKTSATFNHHRKAVTINGTEYGHAFGYSFYKSATVDSVTFYLPTNTQIASIDVYGATLTEKNGKTLYGKASSGEEEAPKTYLGTFAVPDAKSGENSIIVSGDLTEAFRVDYIFFAIKFDEGTNDSYKIYEIELFGVLDEAKAPSEYKAADFSPLKEQYAIYNSIVEKDYTAESWARLTAAIALTDPVNKNCLSTKEQIESAAKTLKDALSALVVLQADKNALQSAINSAKTFKELEHTPNSWKALKDALATAESVFAAQNSAQTAIDNAQKALNNAITALEKRGDKTELKKLIDAAKKLEEKYYNGNLTAWKMFANALKKAENVYADDNSTQDIIDNMEAELIFKQGELVTVEGYVPETEPVIDETDATDAPKATETDAPKESTGCGSTVALSALTIVGIIGAGAFIIKKKD